MLHKDAIVQLTRDMQLPHDMHIAKGSAGRVLSTITLRHACMVSLQSTSRRS